MLAVIIRQKGRKDTGENAGQLSRPTGDSNETADNTPITFPDSWQVVLTSESNHEALVKGDG